MGRTTADQQTAAAAQGDVEGRLVVDARGTVALLDADDAARVRFEGIAVGVGVFHDVVGRRIRIRAEHLDGIAKRLAGVFIRDLHRENIGATVGLVHAASVDGDEVRFTGYVRVQPFVDVVRAFWDRIRLSLGFRFDPADLKPNDDGTYDLPDKFLVDHLAVVARGRFPNARLTRLLNDWRGASPGIHGTPPGAPRSVSQEQPDEPFVPRRGHHERLHG